MTDHFKDLMSEAHRHIENLSGEINGLNEMTDRLKAERREWEAHIERLKAISGEHE